jgi:hypothetical protein
MPKEKNKKSDRKKKTGKKGSQLAIRIEESERDAFVALCDRLDTSAAREIRRFMRDFVASHAPPAIPEPEVTAEAGSAETVAPEPPRKARTRKPRASVPETAPQPAMEQPSTEEAPAPRKRAPRKAPAA